MAYVLSCLQEDGWTFLLNTAREYDHEKIDGWKDDLNNLLVFVRESNLD